MARESRPRVLDDDPLLPLTVKIPTSLHRTLQLYCRYRGHDESRAPKAAVAAISAYFARDAAFQRWRQEHPEPSGPASAAPVGKPSRRRAGQVGDGPSED